MPECLLRLPFLGLPIVCCCCCLAQVIAGQGRWSGRMSASAVVSLFVMLVSSVTSGWFSSASSAHLPVSLWEGGVWGVYSAMHVGAHVFSFCFYVYVFSFVCVWPVYGSPCVYLWACIGWQACVGWGATVGVSSVVFGSVAGCAMGARCLLWCLCVCGYAMGGKSVYSRSGRTVSAGACVLVYLLCMVVSVYTCGHALGGKRVSAVGRTVSVFVRLWACSRWKACVFPQWAYGVSWCVCVGSLVYGSHCVYL
jgi:hypothetical protein